MCCVDRLNSPVKADGFVVNQDQIDFVMRYPEHFNRVFDRRLTAKPIDNCLLVMVTCEEIVEFLVKAKIGQVGFQVYNPGLQ